MISNHARARRARAVVASAGHDGRGLRHAAPLGAGILAARMGPAEQKSDRRASSDALLALSRRRGKYAARSKAQQEQLRIAAAAAVALLFGISVFPSVFSVRILRPYFPSVFSKKFMWIFQDYCTRGTCPQLKGL